MRDQLTQGLQETGLFQVGWTDTATAARQVREGDVHAALVLPDRFLDRFFSYEDVTVRLWKDPNSQIKAGIVESILAGMVRQWQAGEAAYLALWPETTDRQLGPLTGPWQDLTSGEPRRMLRALRQDDGSLRRDALDQMERGMAFFEALEEPPVRLVLADRQDWEAASGDARTSRNLYDYFLPSFAVFFMMWSAAAIARDLHRERENRTLARLLTGPVSLVTVVLSKWMTAVVVASVQLLVLLVAGGLLFGVRVLEAPVAIALVVAATAGAAASVYLILGLLVRTEKAMDALTTVFTLISGMIGGNFFPVDLMPPSLHYAGLVTFNYWANRALSDLVTHGRGLLAVVPELLALAAIATVGVIIAAGVFALRQRKGVAA
jgi:ABC-type multidrug transport system permease subunit